MLDSNLTVLDSNLLAMAIFELISKNYHFLTKLMQTNGLLSYSGMSLNPNPRNQKIPRNRKISRIIKRHRNGDSLLMSDENKLTSNLTCVQLARGYNLVI